MKKTRHTFWLLFILSPLFFACQSGEKQGKETSAKPPEKFHVTDSLLETAVIYEANIRQYSPEGTLKAFEKDIPVLKELGVKIIWLMPVYPISELKRKATGNTFVEDIPDPEARKKYLGSPYAVADYTAVNPDFGTKEDLRSLIRTAHRHGMAVILDFVPNHTGWDHPWIKEHPEFYTKNEKGEITDPLNPDGTSKGWTDVADLNYDNPQLRREMIKAMRYWIENFDIDGYRCDVAGEVPLDFWREAIPELRKIKPLFMLAEAWEPELLQDGLFDACYGWEAHFLLADIAKGKKSVADWDRYVRKIDTMYEPDDILMHFTSNHDENSWKGTVYETFGDAWEVMAVTTYMIKGMPLLYSGQEYGLAHRLKFFEKDSIPKTKGKEFALYRFLGRLKNGRPALNGGKQAAAYRRIAASHPDVLAFERIKAGDTLVFVANFSAKPVRFSLPLSGDFRDEKQHTVRRLSPEKELDLKAWDYLILTPQ